jgi:NodT family efflux transporter outer membrane factor (OMF) lipoprotein
MACAGRRTLVVCVMLVTAGCMIGPDFKSPKAPIAAQWLEADYKAVDSSRQEYRDWWSVFDDSTLSDLIETAYEQNLTLQAAGVRVLQARAELGVALGELYPQQQQVSASVTRNRIPVSVPYKIISPTYWQNVFGAQAAWEIDLWGKLRRGVESADQAYLASVAAYDDVLVTLTGDVASAYVQIRVLQAQLRIAEENVERQEKTLEIARARFAGGVVTKRDVYQAENVLGATQATIPQLNVALQTAKNALAVLLGLPPGPMDHLLGGPSDIPEAPPQVAVGIPADLLRRRPDIRKAELDAAAQCAQIGFTKADLLPAFSLVGNVGTLATDIGRAKLTDVFTSRSLSYAVGPAVQWNILNYGQLTNDVRVQDAKFQELIVTYQNTVLKAQQEVEDGITKFVQSRDQVNYLTKSVHAALGALTISLLEYKQGTVDFTAVLDSLQNLYQAQNNLAVARGNVPLGLIGAYRALGGGWQIREGRDFVPDSTRAEMARRTNWGTWLTPDLLRPEAPGLPSPDDRGPLVRPPEW